MMDKNLNTEELINKGLVTNINWQPRLQHFTHIPVSLIIYSVTDQAILHLSSSSLSWILQIVYIRISWLEIGLTLSIYIYGKKDWHMMAWYTQRKHAQHDYPRLFETSIENGEKKERESTPTEISTPYAFNWPCFDSCGSHVHSPREYTEYTQRITNQKKKNKINRKKRQDYCFSSLAGGTPIPLVLR